MKTDNSVPERKLFFLDNLRSITVMFVVIFHVALGYVSIGPWWYTKDTALSELVLDIAMVIYVFIMPILFFVSGYFAVPSYEKHGERAFYLRKFKRLILPFIIGSAFLTPILLYVRQINWSLQQGVPLVTYYSLWINHFRSINTISMELASQSQTIAIQHLWYLCILFVYFIIFGLLYKIRIISL